MKKLISLMFVLVFLITICGCKKTIDNGSSLSVDSIIIEEETIEIENPQSNQTGSQADKQTTDQIVDGNNSDTGNEDKITTSSENTSSVAESQPDPNAGKEPSVTLCAQVEGNTYIVGGVCSSSTEYVTVGGIGVQAVKVVPVKGKNNSYFITQVKIDFSTTIEVQAKEQGKNLSGKVKKFVMTNLGMQNMMTQSDYMPVFGLDNRMHYYSAILSYTLSGKVDNGIKQIGKSNIAATVTAAKNVGAEVIYLVVPSSAAVYPETVPSEYKPASGETVYKAFESVATQCGAKVIYPLDIMKAHKNDGEGYKIYSHTDSHWTTYGAYWGVNSLMSYIAGKYPSAAPRTVSEMGFYTAELYAGDGLFSFGDNKGFENYSYAASTNGETKITGIKELTTLYKYKMPTDTLSKITRGKKSVYLTKDNANASVEDNSGNPDLPSAIIVRDSFARTAYDMINDRFSKVTWLAEGDYTGVVNQTYANNPNYVIYIVSERNLIKVMLGNKDVSLTSFR